MASQSSWLTGTPTHLCVLDFEATCDAPVQVQPQEIIELPVVLLDVQSGQVTAEFHTYVKPKTNPVLTPFCTQLTAITQAQVDTAPQLSEALNQLHDWGVQQGLWDDAGQPCSASSCNDDDAAGDGSGAATAVEGGQQPQGTPAGGASCHPLFVTCGDWDLKHLHSEARLRGTKPRPYFSTVCNIKVIYEQWMQHQAQQAGGAASRSKKQKQKHSAGGMMGMLQALGLPHVGHHHSGIDDARNIARIASELAKRGFPAVPTGFFDPQAGFARIPT